jgi:DNA polymerase-1
MPDLLVALDGDSLAHRAYHALPPLWAKDGESRHAVYGFGSMLCKVLGELRPRYGAVAFDTPEPTFRHVAYPRYKAQRPDAPDDLYAQIPHMRTLAGALGLACLDWAGFEADDVLGTLARQAVAAGLDVVVVTSDSDALQLVGPGVRVLMPHKGFSESVMHDTESVLTRYGVEPGRIPDLKALTGDSSDNIAGLPGVGPKTAARWLAEHGSLDAILADPARVSPRHCAALLAHADRLRHARALTSICPDVPLELDLVACRVQEYDRAAAATTMQDLGVPRLATRLPSYADHTEAPPIRARRRGQPTSPLQRSLFE